MLAKEFGLAKMLRLVRQERRRQRQLRFTETGEGLVFYRPGVGDITKLIRMQSVSESLRDIPTHQTQQ